MSDFCKCGKKIPTINGGDRRCFVDLPQMLQNTACEKLVAVIGKVDAVGNMAIRMADGDCVEIDAGEVMFLRQGCGNLVARIDRLVLCGIMQNVGRKKDVYRLAGLAQKLQHIVKIPLVVCCGQVKTVQPVVKKDRVALAQLFQAKLQSRFQIRVVQRLGRAEPIAEDLGV